MITQTQPQQPTQTPRPSPIGDLIARHREEMRVIWERHAAEVRNPKWRAA